MLGIDAVVPRVKSNSMNPPEFFHKAVDYLEQREWEAAHRIVQSEDSADACWLHGIVHVLEGDLVNARYWYARAGRAFSSDAASEIVAARKLMS
ncbi:MAG: hypothetical protein ABI854_00800 [Betaproteobacteria bacterium]